jgi:endonuclease/exonuclease/phosphatase family metal-dependent hydrolase
MPLQRPATAVTAAPTTLAVITWNMHEGQGDLQRLLSDLAAGELTGSSPLDYALLIQEAVAGMRPDLESIARERQLSFAFEPVRTIGGRAMGNAILSTQPLTSVRVIALPRARQPRMALAATIRIADVQLFVVNAHFENRVSLWRGLVFGDTARGRQATALLAQLSAGPGIAGGDLNTSLGPTEPALKVLRARFPDTPGGPAEPTFRNRLVLDHLFFDLPDGWQVDRRVLPDTYGSDHHPVLGVISAP